MRNETLELAGFRAILDTALDAVVLMRPDGTIADWNPVAEATFGWSREEAIGRRMAELIVPPEYRASHIQGLARYNETGSGPVLGRLIEISALRRSGEQFPIELSITVTHSSQGPLFIGFLRDISRRKKTAAALERQAVEAQLLYRITQFAAEAESVDAVLEQTLRTICQLTGWPVGHALLADGSNGEALVSTDIWHNGGGEGIDGLREATRRMQFRRGVGLPGVILETGEPAWMTDTENEAVFIRKGLGYASAFGFPVKNAGEVVAVLEFFTQQRTPPDEDVLITVRTVGEQVGRVLERNQAIAKLRALNDTLEQRVTERTTELFEAQDQLRQSQKMEAIGKLTGGVAHDFNNLLTVIRSSVDLLQRPNLSDEKRRRYLDAIGSTADRAAKLTGQLLAFARREPLNRQVFDLVERIRGSDELLRATLGSRVTLSMNVECDACLVEADPNQLEAALINMAVNARDAMDGEGSFSVRVGNAKQAPGAPAPDHQMIELAISDTGHGIPAEEISRIFEPFYTSKAVGKGTGLGLSQVYGFVTQSGGEIRVESEVGSGTTFHLFLPKSQKALTIVREFTPEEKGDRSPARILVVEDNQEIGEFAAQLLQEHGYSTAWAGDAGTALERLATDPDEFDLVFTDIIMPGGMDGIELARTIQDQYDGLPVVLTSGYSDALVQGEGSEFPLLRKPYSVESLSHLIRQSLRTDPQKDTLQ